MFVVMFVKDSHSVWGPFKSADAAAKWAENNLSSPGWCVCPMAKPEKFK